ncbi:MAG: hypothetical protein LBR30_01765 [Clostridioides sp.]|jgi:uncharacterized protein YneF (UPF0154 family)|nr:hypothetical protein [Clostridioides sp.]
MSLELIILNVIIGTISTILGGITVYYISKKIDYKTAMKNALGRNKDEV